MDATVLLLGAAIGLVATLAVAGLLLFSRTPRFTQWRHVNRRFTCPSSGEEVTGTLVWNGAWQNCADIVACSAFSEPGNVTCQKPCLEPLNEEARLRWRTEAGLPVPGAPA